MEDTTVTAAHGEGESWIRGLPVGITVFVSGAAVMIYEFIAVRFLQRSFGSSLDIWASEIAVCMAGLAVGYWLGGFLSDRFHSWGVLGKALLLAGFTGFFMEWIADGLGSLLVMWEPDWLPPMVYSLGAAGAAAGACSFVPFLALGTVLPQSVRLYVRRLDEVGHATGWIAALSTVGSIVGVLLTVVFLFFFGVRETLWGASAVLMGYGLLLVAICSTASQGRFATAILTFYAAFGSPAASAQIIFEQYTAYHHMLVEDKPQKRILWFDNAPQSTMSRRDPVEGGFEYTDFFHFPVLLNPAINTVLFVGLGGGTGPKVFLRDYPNVQIDVAEIDPAVVQVARDFFSVPHDPRLRITVGDGRVFLRRATRSYGAILMDAYSSGPYGACLPYHLATREFFELAWNRLVDGGCLIYNVIGVYGGFNDSVVRDMHATLASVFPHVYVFQAHSSKNTVFLALKAERGASQQLGTLRPWPGGPWLNHPLDADGFAQLANTLLDQSVIRRPVLSERAAQFSKAAYEPLSGQILTDNYAPVDISSGRAFAPR